MKRKILLVKIRTTQEGVADLKQVVSLIKFSRKSVFKKSIIFLFSGAILKSPSPKTFLLSVLSH